MAKSKEFTSKKADFAKGGNTPMFSEQQAGKQTPGKTGKNGATGKGQEFLGGGKGKMFGFRPVAAAKAGQTGQ